MPGGGKLWAGCARVAGRVHAAWARQTVWDRLFLLSLAVAVAIVCLTFADYGITTDEPLHVEYGRRALAWYLSLGHDRDVLEFENLYLYGALYDTPVAIAEALSPFDLYATRRLVGGLVGLAGVVAVWRIGRDMARFGGAGGGSPRQVGRAGLAAAWCLLLTPNWWGHSFANPKDVPFAVAAAWTLSWLVRAAQELPAGPLSAEGGGDDRRRPRLRTVLWLGVAFGAALGIRVGGVILAGPIALAPLAWVSRRAWRWVPPDGRGGLALGPRLRAVAGDTGLMIARFWPLLPVAYLIMLAAWPWAQTAPLRHPLEALDEFSKFPLDFTFVFNGVTLRTTELPWWYLPVGFGVKLPEVVLAALAGAVVLLAVGWGRQWRRGRGTAPWLRLDMLVVAAAILLPPLAVAAGVAIDRLARLLPLAGRVVLAVALLGDAGAQVVAMARLHPYEDIWFNQLAGGVAGAQGRFELDYWGAAMSRAARDLVDAVVSMDGGAALDQPYRVRVCGPPTNAFYYLPPAWKPSRRASGPVDFYIAFTREACKGAPDGPDLVEVRREGVLLAFARDLRRPAPPATPVPPVPEPPPAASPGR